MSRAGLGHERKPVGSFLFAGRPGRETEVTVQLAKAMDIELLRFDMSEYMERHTVSRRSARLRAMLVTIRAGC